jgi:hypothetical protein
MSPGGFFSAGTGFWAAPPDVVAADELAPLDPELVVPAGPVALLPAELAPLQPARATVAVTPRTPRTPTIFRMQATLGTDRQPSAQRKANEVFTLPAVQSGDGADP